MKVINSIKIETILFLDIETAPNWLEFKDLPENVRTEWIYKFKFRADAPNNHEDIFDRQTYDEYFAELWRKEAGLFPEFSRVVCISVGFMFSGSLYLRSYVGKNEGEVLTKFKADLQHFETAQNGLARLCAHFGKGFDYPFLAKRMLINRIALPNSLDVAHLKPWEQMNLDTQEIWKFGGVNSAGLPALCLAFGLETPKDDLDGSKVAAAFHAGELSRIAEYCEKDVLALVNVFKAMRIEEPVQQSQIINNN